MNQANTPVKTLFSCRWSGILLAGVMFGCASGAAARDLANAPVEDYLDMPLGDLLSLEVSSVSRKLQQLREAAAAVFVITADDIRRSGATSIPEVLRMAPGVHVARVNTRIWAVTARGFNGGFSNKLLVLMDGRTLYTPAFSGVYWDVQDTLLDDIERIEVIRGPGATLWGANAVNGIINIITKHAADTQGGLLVASSGSEEHGDASIRYGRQLGDAGHIRGFLKYNKRDELQDLASGNGAGDAWEALRGGFRLDQILANGAEWTLQGDLYRADAHENVTISGVAVMPDVVESSGWNLLSRWAKQVGDDAHASLQVYYDYNDRDEILLGQTHGTLDIDFQYQFRPHQRHELIWGLGYHRIDDDFRNTLYVAGYPDSRSSQLFSGFVQDEITLVPEQVRLTLGSKFEHNDYTGFEVQPNARLLWTPSDQHSLWGAVSRAVRTPARLESEGQILAQVLPGPTSVYIFGNPSMQSETLIAYEAGYRFSATKDFSLDVATFYNRYDKLRSNDVSGFPALAFANELRGDSYGLEVAADWHPRDWWRLQLGYTYQEFDLEATGLVPDTLSVAAGEGSTPQHQVSLRSGMDLARNWELDLWARYVGELSASNAVTAAPVDAYTTLDARLAWHPSKDVELSLVGQNLLSPSHLEFIQESYIAPTEVQRSFYGQVRVAF